MKLSKYLLPLLVLGFFAAPAQSQTTTILALSNTVTSLGFACNDWFILDRDEATDTTYRICDSNLLATLFGQAADFDSTGALDTDSVSANELNATGVESELEAELDLADLQGTLGDSKVDDSITVSIATGTVSGGTIGRCATWDLSGELAAESAACALSGQTKPGDEISFADSDSNFSATDVDAAISELDDTNGSGPNAADGKVNWEQIVDMPAGFADGTDDGGGVSTDDIGTDELDDGSATPGAGDWVQVDAGDTSQFDYRTDAELLSDIGGESETHASEHEENGADEMLAEDMGTACTTGQGVTSDGSGGMDCANLPAAPTTSGAEEIVTYDDTGSGTTGTVADWSELEAIISEPQHSVVWSAGGISADGTQCADPTETTINSGPKQYTIICTDNASSIFYGFTPMPDGWDGGTVTFELQALNTAADTNVLDFDFSCQSRGDSDTVSSTWGTAQNASITFSTANDIEHATTAAVTCDGSPAAGDTLFWRAVMDDTATTTAVATAHIMAVKMEYTGSVDDE